MFEFKVEVKYNGHILGVEGEAEEYSPAQGPSFSSPGEPAEGGGVFITDVYMIRCGTKRGEHARRLSKTHVVQLNHDDMFLGIVSEAVIDSNRR